jgi:FeS assembly SUF system regulator
VLGGLDIGGALRTLEPIRTGLVLFLRKGRAVIRLSKHADYGIVIMTNLARQPGRQHNAPEVAAHSHIPLPMASKILKTLARAGLLASHRGVKGGYGLARPAATISVAEVISALDGPIAVTACIEDGPGGCEIEAFCPARANWQRINDAIRAALEGISMAEMAQAIPMVFRAPALGAHGRPSQRPLGSA